MGSTEEELQHTHKKKKSIEHKNKYYIGEVYPLFPGCVPGEPGIHPSEKESSATTPGGIKGSAKLQKGRWKNVEHLTNFSQTRRVLTVVRVGTRQIC